MNDFTPLVRPQQSQVTIDPTAKECPSDGFNWPTYHQLNKQGRVNLSAKPLNPTPTTPYRLFAVANSKGWFAAAATQDGGSFSLIFSPLDELRNAFKTAKDGSTEAFTPKRTISLETQKPNILAFACNDTRLFVSLEAGQLIVYDTAALFTPGTDNVAPLHMLDSRGSLIRQLAPNPGTELGLQDFVAVVRSDGTVALYNMKLEPQGGWAAVDQASAPVSVSWSPKGKHLAIGLTSGDILTYPLNNKTLLHKHIPPTASPPLVSLTWLGPGHTFRTSYAPAVSTSDPSQHIITLDIKASTATYHAPNHPFPLPDRPSLHAYVLPLAKWDEDPGVEAKALVVVGDKASTDLEILGSVGTKWFQQSQENPLSLPLDGNMDDTVLVALDVDLTDVDAGVPVMYAYLNDGTLQGWRVEGSRPYGGMVGTQAGGTGEGLGTAMATTAASTSTAPSTFGQTATTAPPASAFGQQSATTSSGFGQSAFSQQPSVGSGFGTNQAFGASAFGTQPPAGGSGFGQSAFGQAAAAPSAFGQPSSPSAFGQSSTPSAFAQASTPSAFGQTSTPSAFGQTSAPSAFGQTSTPSAFGGGTTTGAFGSGTSTGAFGSGASTGAFGGRPATTGAFRAPGAFGAFASTTSTTNAFGGASFGFGSGTTTSPPVAPEMSREESMTDSTPGFGGLSLGGMGLGESNSDTAAKPKTGGIFGSLPSPPPAPTTMTSAFGAIKPASGFGAFSSYQPATTAGSSEEKKTGGETATGASGFGAAAKPASGFGQSAFGASGFGQPAFGQSAFGKPAVPATTTMATKTPTTGGFGAFASTAPTSLVSAAQQVGTGTSEKMAAPFAGGFGAFASGAPTAFGSAAPKTTPPETGAFGAVAASSPSAFGAAEISPALSPVKSHFAPGVLSGSSPSPIESAGFGGSPFGPQPGVREPSPTAKEEKKEPTTPAKPVTAVPSTSPSSSPEATPRLGKVSIVQDNESPPQPSPFKSGTVASPSGAFGNVISAGSGAFGNIQTSPSAFKPATGFGAFGSDKTPSTSPFFKAAAQPKTPSISTAAFAAALSTPTSSQGAAPSPAFGAASALGSAKSVFAPATPASPTPIKMPATGGFGAFSGSTAGFGAFAGPKKSFGELLKVGDDDSTDPVKKSTLHVTTKADEAKPKTPISAFAPIAKGPVSVFSLPPKDEKKKEEEQKVDVKEEEKTEEQKKQVMEGKQKEETVEPIEEKGKLSEDSSFGNLSLLSDASSFAEVEHEPSGEDEIQSGNEDAEGEENPEFNDETYDIYGEEGEEEDEGFLSDSVASEELSSEEDEEEISDKELPEPALLPLPASRSPSATPQPEVPEIQITPSPPSESFEGSILSTITEESTTPPGTPVKEPSTSLGRPASAPPTTTPSPPFSLGLGRPSTRPTRSSPLASTPVSLEDEDEGEKPRLPIKPLASPQPRAAVLPLPAEDEEDDEGKPSASKRPKTPPLLSAFGPPITPVQKPATIPSATTSTSAPSSLFGKPKSPVLVTPEIKEGMDASKSPSPSPGSSLFDTAPKPLAPTTPGIYGTLPAPSVSLPPKPAAPSPTGISITPPVPSKPAAPESIFISPSTPSKPAGSIFSTPPVPFTSPATTKTLQNAPAQGTTVTLAPFDLSGLSFKGKGTTTPSTPAAPAPFDLSGFSSKGKGPASSPPTTLFGGAVPPAQSLAPVKLQTPVPPEASLPEGMQKECAALVTLLTQELAKLQRLAEDSAKRMEVTKSLGGSRRKADLGDSGKWALADVKQFGQVLQQYEKDLDEISEFRESQKQTIREIQSSMLKAGTRKEEIRRFDKANGDKDFAKMLKARTLGPEHLEAQTQLRRKTWAMRDRVQKLEDHLKTSKKKLAQANSGTPGLKAPSLDTINRTYRNIDIAIQQQADDVAKLSSRISKLKLSSPALTPATSASSPRDARLPDSPARRQQPYNVTPNVAITTAAALNAERSAHRLKRALLAARSEPLLNTKAAAAPPAPVAFNTPQKPAAFKPPPDFGFKTPLPASLFPVAPDSTEAQSTPGGTIPIPLPDWTTLPEDNFYPSTPPAARRGTGASVKKHGSVPLKKNGTGASPSQAPAFSWGPLPTFDKVPATSMVQAVRVTPPNTWFKAPETGVAGKSG